MNRSKVRAVVAGLAALFLGGSTLAAQDWVFTGGPNGNDVDLFEQVGVRVFAGSTFGLYRSTNFGGDWQLVLGATEFGTVTALDGEGDTVFAGTVIGRIARSTDGGDTWEEMTSPDPGVFVSSVVFDSSRLYAVTITFGQFGELVPGPLWVSDDQGVNWAPLPTPGPVSDKLFVNGQTIIAQGVVFGFFAQIYRSFDGGLTWDAPSGAFFQQGNDIVAHAGALFMFTQATVRRSDDIGASWTILQTEGLTGVGTSSTPPEMISTGTTLVLTANPNIYKSDDGIHWTAGAAGPLAGSFHTVRGIAYQDGTLLVAGSTIGVFKAPLATMAGWESANEGYGNSSVFRISAVANRPVVASVLNEALLWQYSGLDGWTSVAPLGGASPAGTTLRALRIWHRNQDTVFVGTQTRGIFRSDDAGVSWQPVNTGVPEYNGTAGQQYHEIEAFTESAGVIYAGTGRGLEFASDGSQSFNTIGGGALRSFDGGQSWQAFNAGLTQLPNGPFGEARYDPIISMASTGDVVIAGHWFSGMRRSVNGGVWQEANTGFPDEGGLPGASESMVVLDGVVWAAVRFVSFNNVVKSLDQGQTWQSASGNLPPGRVTSLVADGDTVYAALISSNSFDTGVWFTDDGGFFWQRAGTGLDGVRVLDLTAADGRVYAGTNGLGVWRFGAPESPLGDLNCDGVVNAGDIEPFALALIDSGSYQSTYPGCNINNADMNQDESTDGADITGFIGVLTAP